MAQRRDPVVKKTAEILEDLFSGHRQALDYGSAQGKRYLLNFLEKYHSIPNAVKFFLYDLLTEDAYQADDPELCRQAVKKAGEYLAAARSEAGRQWGEYLPSVRFLERGIALLLDDGEIEPALALCDQAVALGLGAAYTAKKSSIERMRW